MSESEFDKPYQANSLDDERFPEPDYSGPMPRHIVERLRSQGVEPRPELLAPEDRLPLKQDARTAA